jgi:hypothetical protein
MTRPEWDSNDLVMLGLKNADWSKKDVLTDGYFHSQCTPRLGPHKLFSRFNYTQYLRVVEAKNVQSITS